MRGVYTVSHSITDLNSSKTLMLIQAASSHVIEILSVYVNNSTVETNQQLIVGIHRVTSLGTPVGTSVTPEKHENGDASSLATIKGNITASEPTYSAVPLEKAGFSSIAGFNYIPIPEERIYIQPSGAIGIRLLSSPDISFDCTVSVVFREIG